MDATPISFDTATALDAGFPAGGSLPDDAERKWAALHDAAAIVAALAGVPDAADPGELHDFTAAVRQAPPARRELARQGLEDLVALMAPGLSALLTVHGHGGDTSAPALALWQEFAAGREALVSLVLPHD
jgi:hypothetical protein